VSAAGDPVSRLRSLLAAQGLDAIVVNGPLSVRWLTGYTGSNGLVCVAPDEVRFLTDFRYATSVDPLRASFDVRIVDQDLVAALAGDFASLVGRGLRVGFESQRLTYAGWAALDEAAGAAGSELVPTSGELERLRAVKAPDELERIRAGARITDQVYEWLADRRLVGEKEAALAWEIEARFRDLGAEGAAFPPIVASGSQAALPHGRPRDVAIERGTLVVIDIGARVEGYASDCTRTFATGTLEDEAIAAYEVVLRAEQEALSLVRPGTPCIEVHERARAVIGEAGLLDHFQHGTGHGVGLDIHEEPRFRAGFGGVLEPGNVVTVEPGVYFPGRFGVRIEDLVVVTEGGHEVLSQFQTSLIDAG
jgi:Xaa-Pro aminopeptidase